MKISRRAVTAGGGAAGLLLMVKGAAASIAKRATGEAALPSHHVHVSTGFGISTNHPAATAAANTIRLQGGGALDMYLAALACAWVADPADCSPFGRMQGVFSVAGETRCLNAGTGIRHVRDSTIPIPGNIAAWFSLRRDSRLRLANRDLVAPAIALARQGFAPSPTLTFIVQGAAPHMGEDLKAIYLDRGAVRARIRNPALADLLQILGESTDEHQFWRTLRAGDAGPWRPEETLDNPVAQPDPRNLDLNSPKGLTERLLTTGSVETWGTWTLLGAAIAVELRRRGALNDFSRAMEAYLLGTILLLDRLPFAVGTLTPKVPRPSVDIDIPSEARAIAARVVRLLNAPVEVLWRELHATYFVGPGSHTDDKNTNGFAIASGDEFLSFTTSIGPWFGSNRTWWGAALGYSYAMKSGIVFDGQTRDCTEMSPLILEAAGRPRLAMSAAGSERILGALTYLLFLRFGLAMRGDMADLMEKPRLFPKDGKIRIHRNFWSAACVHLRKRGFVLAPTDYNIKSHLGIVNLVERLDNRRYKSGADPSSGGDAL